VVKRLKVAPEPVSNTHPAYSSHFPPEYWELLELVMDGADEPAIKAHRSLVIGKGKGQPKILTARQADAAIRAATLQHYGTDKPEEIKRHLDAGNVAWPEDVESYLKRQAWYVLCGWPVIMVKSVHWGWRPQVLEFLCSIPVGYEVRVLEHDDEGVDRLPVPTSWRTSGVRQGRHDQDQDQGQGHQERD